MSTKSNARAFLEKVSTDPAFRARVESDPVGALQEFGFDFPADRLPPEGIKLPSNQAIQGNLDRLSERMEATSGEIFFAL